MTVFVKYTKTQVKKLIKTNGFAIVKFLPSKANPYSEWFSGTGVTIKSLELLEKYINEYAYYNCNSEVGNRVAYWVDESENVKSNIPKENCIPCWRVKREGEEGFMYCMNSDYASRYDRAKRRIVEGVVFTPHDEWTEQELQSGIENNFFFWDDKYKEMTFLKNKKGGCLSCH